MAAHRLYETQLYDDDSELTISIRSIPRSTAALVGGDLAFERLFSRTPGRQHQVVSQFVGPRHRITEWDRASGPVLREAVTTVLLQAQEEPSSLQRRDLPTFPSDFVESVCSSPVVAFESSWPKMDSLSTAIVAAGGTEAAIGIAVASGALGPVALVVVPAGMIIISAARGLKFRAGRLAGPDVREELRELQSLLGDELIDEDDYEVRKQQILDASYGPAS